MSSQSSAHTLAGDDREDIELPLWPFQDLRVASGMLLDTEDFHVILGNPRAKMRLHQSWLHGSGVVWGLPVSLDEKEGLLQVGPGLAVDGWGRELRVEQQQCLSVRAWARKWLERHLADLPEKAPDADRSPCGCRRTKGGGDHHSDDHHRDQHRHRDDHDPGCGCDHKDQHHGRDHHEDHDQGEGCGCGHEHHHDQHHQEPRAGCGCEAHEACVYVVVRADLCLDRLVPALADPCDTSRGHNEESRVLELARVEIVDDRVEQWCPYPRVRALFGLDPDSPYSAPGGVAAEAAARVAAATPDRRAANLLAEVRCLAALDVTQTTPPEEEGTDQPGLFPVDLESVPVMLARLCLEVEDGGCVRLREVDECVRRALLPTTTIQDLLCGDLTAALGGDCVQDAGGPRLDGCLDWNDDKDHFQFGLTSPAAPGSQERAVEVSSLSDRGRGWAREECRRIRLSKDGLTVTVHLEHPPSYALVRVVIRGTGRTPLYGKHPRVPFAGKPGGPPGTRDDGHDAVVTEHFRSLEPPTGEETS
jgi:hypothetical protein